jgi:ABC-2 type transport system ATP-binding protein
MQRRVEVAKGLLHNPEVLLLDEPSTGLDPGARLDLWKYLKQLKEKEGTTILLTTHLMEEAEKCDRLGILSAGRLVAVGTPEELKSSIGGDVVTIQTSDPEQARSRIEELFGLEATPFDGAVRFEWKGDPSIVAKISEALAGSVHSITLGKPTLEDVFIDKTGHTFWEEEHE